jgi:L,D-transpeptidase ErfK/SrfK
LFIPYFSLFSSPIEDIVGNIKYYTIKKDQTLIAISRKHNLAFPEVMLSNSDIKDPWVLKEGKTIKLPTRHILPSGKREGIIINKGDLRAYFFKDQNVYTFPIGIGRANWDTPTGQAKVTGKKKHPFWTVPKSILEEEPDWPKVVKPGPDNPLGTRAIYFSMPGYLLHGTNKPWGVGMRVSHGCIRFYPEGIESLFNMINEGDQVKIVDQKVKAGWQGGVLYLEVHTMHIYGLEEEEAKKPNIRLLPEAARLIQTKAGVHIAKINWEKVTEIVRKANGMPQAVLTIYN